MDWPAASQVLSEGLRSLRGEHDLEHNAAYVVQERTDESLSTGGSAALVATVEQVKQAFPDLPTLQDTLDSVLGRELERYVAEDRAQDALTLLSDCASTFANDSADELEEIVYERWAQAESDSHDLAEAVRIYDLGLAELPNSSPLKQNRDYFSSKLE